MKNKDKLEALNFLKPVDDPFDVREMALKFLPECGMACGLEHLTDYMEAIGDKQMANAIRRMMKLKKNVVVKEIENHMYSAFDRKGIKQRIREGGRI